MTRTYADGIEAHPSLVTAIIGYGGRCRECADADGTCPGSGLPCDPKSAQAAVRHVLDALAYYRAHPEFLDQIRAIRTLSPSPSGIEDAREAALPTVRNERTVAAARRPLPRLTDDMIEAAMVGHYGKQSLPLTINGLDLTSKGINYSFRTGFRRMWNAVNRHLLHESASSKIGGDHGASSLRARDGGEGL